MDWETYYRLYIVERFGMERQFTILMLGLAQSKPGMTYLVFSLRRVQERQRWILFPQIGLICHTKLTGNRMLRALTRLLSLTTTWLRIHRHANKIQLLMNLDMPWVSATAMMVTLCST